MSLTQASDPENMQVKINSSDKQSKNGDEQIEGMSVSDVPEFQDPAILVVREIAKIRYSKDQLLSLRDVPFSKKKPDFLDSSEVSPSILDPERWNFDRKKPQAASNAEGGASVTSAPDEHRRRPGGADPRERVRKEGDGIVLSPQRRSFNSGCFVPTRGGGAGAGEGGSRNVVGGRPHSPLGANTGKNDGHVGIREIQPSNNRRIGSGRILRDSWDFNEKPDSSADDYGGGFRNQPQRDRDDKLYERRSFGRDFDMTRERSGEGQKERRSNGRFDRRRISDREQEEPEWFSGGPVSQNDTIELRGFDDCDRPGKKKLSPSRIRRAKDWSKKKSNEAQPAAAVATAAANVDGINEETKTVAPVKMDEEIKKPKDEKEEDKPEDVDGMLLVNDSSFNFDEILKCDTIPGLLTNGVGGDGDNQAKSRFSRWFKKQDSPEKRKPEESRVSATPDDDDQRLIKDLLKDISETSVSIPGDSESYFAPISPASNTTNASNFAGRQQQGMSIMEMLQRGKIQQQQQQGEQQQGINIAKQSTQMAGKILSLDELEAKMRQNVDVTTGMPQKHSQQKPDEEMTAAFKKLLSQAQGGGHPATSNGPMNKSQPMSLLEMLNHSQQQDEAVRLSVAATSHLLGPASPNIINHHHHQMHQVNELQLKLQQAQYHQQQKQMEMLNKLINATAGGGGGAGQLRASPSLHDMGAQQSRELLSRPEAQAILQGLKRGEITTQHLYQQLANPALQPRHRDMLTTILKVQGGGYGGPSPRVLSPAPPSAAAPAHHMYQQQQLRVSPLPPNALHQRIPSPRELQVHTQNILQRALIKKKLEEQQENYRKKQELQRGQSPGVSGANGSQSGPKSVASPTPLAFTPTSVLRKMTADKDEGKENKAAGDAKVPPGRPLTGMRPQLQQPQSQQWTPQYTSVKQPVGRPIVKANNSYQSQTAEQFFTQQQQRIFNQAIQAAASAQQPALQPQQQQQQRKPNGPQYGPGQAPSGVAPSQYSYQSAANQQFAQQLTQQQLRAQHQHRPANQQQGQQQQPMGFQQQQPQQQAGHQHQGIGAAAWQQFFNTAQQAASRASNSSASARSIATAGGGCDLSPTTSDQLARWFSPDLLAKARGGELPSTAGLGQHALSLEEIERQTAPPVHN